MLNKHFIKLRSESPTTKEIYNEFLKNAIVLAKENDDCVMDIDQYEEMYFRDGAEVGIGENYDYFDLIDIVIRWYKIITDNASDEEIEELNANNDINLENISFDIQTDILDDLYIFVSKLAFEMLRVFEKTFNDSKYCFVVINTEFYSYANLKTMSVTELIDNGGRILFVDDLNIFINDKTRSNIEYAFVIKE